MMIDFKQAEAKLIAAGKRLDALNLAPATSGNYSIRLSDKEIVITESGNHKGKLQHGDFLRVDMEGKPLEDKKPSAETLLHCQLYKCYEKAQAILHTHSVAGTVLTRFFDDQAFITLTGYEMLKIYPGNAKNTHDISVHIPVFDNTQDMVELSARVDPVLQERPDLSVYLIRGHGLYAWGETIEQAEYITEATEMMLKCELETLKLKGAMR
tara:strand:- start:1028 stop:1660 length:633 start_codon:yes stop_codon:yes gene_type:complete